MVLLILALLWSIVLGPWAWRARTERRRMRSVDNFRRRLQVLAPVSDVPRATNFVPNVQALLRISATGRHLSDSE